jgi:hypothetical protein
MNTKELRDAAAVFLAAAEDQKIELFHEGTWSHIYKPSFDQPLNRYRIAKEDPVVWNGQGLPPVGTVCEAVIPHSSGEDDENKSIIWIEGVVIAHHEINGKTFTWFAERDGFYPPNVLEFRPIRTPEQIAYDQRDSAIAYMLKVCFGADLSRRERLAALYDAGYRKQ